jgi:hypothetical protein
VHFDVYGVFASSLKEFETKWRGGMAGARRRADARLVGDAMSTSPAATVFSRRGRFKLIGPGT